MNIAYDPPGADPLVLDELLDLQAAAPLREALLARRGADLQVDASGVRRLGGLCLQVLLAADGAWSSDGRRLAFLNPAPAFVDALDLCGVRRADADADASAARISA